MTPDRSYQEPLIDATRAEIARLRPVVSPRKPRVLIRSECGSGKTVTATKIGKACIEKGGTIAFIVHRSFLLEQTSETFTKWGIRHSFLANGKPLNSRSKAHICMVGSMKKRQSLIKPPTICFVDEASHVVAKTWKAVIEAWPETTFIYLSATPSQRTDGVGLEGICDGIVHGPSAKHLIDIGALSAYRYFELQPPDLSQVHTRMGEYVSSEVDAEMTKAVIVGDIVSTYKRAAMGTRAIYFANSIATSKRYAEAFNAAGIPARHLDKDTPAWERKQIARLMADNKVLVMCNCGIATMGFDLAAQAGKDVTIETVGLCRPTKSFPLLVQMAMRALRAKDKPGIILDHAGSYKEFGWLPDDDVEWNLSGAERKPKLAPDIKCPGCHATLSPSVSICPHCRTNVTEERAAVERKRAEIEHVEGQLVEIKRRQEQEAAALEAAQKLDKRREEWQCKTLEDWRALAARRGLKPGWAWYRYNNQKRRA
jgi:DNA repair protein RadD